MHAQELAQTQVPGAEDARLSRQLGLVQERLAVVEADAKSGGVSGQLPSTAIATAATLRDKRDALEEELGAVREQEAKAR
jgi:hypothetical protein